ncbi:MAG: hypothetical protein AAGH19_10615 [Pseudomonadota bacterium]
MTAPEANAVDHQKRSFREELRLQRWDDHRYYHHSRINQSLHLFSSICFMTTYTLLFLDPGAAAILGWVFAMWSRQIGHFFFEPKGFDEVNEASHEHKEDIKIGYNLVRKRVLLGIWGFTPVVLYLKPDLWGLITPHADRAGYLHNLSMLWLILAGAALAFRTIQLFFIHSVQTGLVWATKILTDPFHDFRIYLKSPLYLMRGELIDPMIHIRHGVDPDDAEAQPAAVTR